MSIASTFLFVLGFFEDIVFWDLFKGVGFWVLSGILGIPGFYVLCLFIQAWKAPEKSSRRRTLIRELPYF